jgi:hypothetical protein
MTASPIIFKADLPLFRIDLRQMKSRWTFASGQKVTCPREFAVSAFPLKAAVKQRKRQVG